MIITSLLDTDLYKFTMMQAVLHHHPAAQVQYRFKCRTPGVALADQLEEISAEIDALCTLRFRADELDYLRGLRFIKSDFVDFLGLFHLDRKYIQLRASPTVPGEIELDIAGPWLHTILFEVPLLAIINEVWFRHAGTADAAEGERRLDAKIARLREGGEDCVVADYGTRRRYSRQWHARVLPALKDGLGAQFAGTSNVYFAREYGMTPLGTMAHEWLQAFQALGPRLRDSQAVAFDVWAKEYRGDLGIALSDVVGLKAFSARFRFCISASCSTACATIRAIRSGGAGDPRAPGAYAHRPAKQDAGVQRRPGRGEGAAAARTLPWPLPAGVRHRHQPDQRSGADAFADCHQNDPLQRPAGRQTERFARQEHVRG